MSFAGGVATFIPSQPTAGIPFALARAARLGLRLPDIRRGCVSLRHRGARLCGRGGIVTVPHGVSPFTQHARIDGIPSL